MRRISRIRRSLFMAATLLLVPGVAIQAVDRLFVLTAEDRLAYYRIEGPHSAKLVRSYSKNDFPAIFPARHLEIKSGNILTTYDSQRNRVGQLVFDSASEQLAVYRGEPGSAATLTGRTLERPALDEKFRGEGSLYAKPRGMSQELELPAFWSESGRRYVALFALGGHVGGLKTDAIERLTAEPHSTKPAAPKAWLQLAGSQFNAVAVSPWHEAFVSDRKGPVIRRFQLKDGVLVAGSEMKDKEWSTLGALAFNPDGDLFVAVHTAGASHEIHRYSFVLDDFVNWRPMLRDKIKVEGGLLDLALARPVGWVLSEKTNPLVKLSAAEAGGHFGISQTVLVSPQTNSEASLIALVEYEPGGHTPVHYHAQMEQVEVVISGRALWEVGEMEREVGPGDVIFCPRYVKHGYKVLGDQPFKFLQLEWRDLKPNK
ncbi:MAG: cupin domain-containing protein [Acidimicrobiia bacterium]|nr:cupin domain-containing protein [Acidimicrobiia bacterium]